MRSGPRRADIGPRRSILHLSSPTRRGVHQPASYRNRTPHGNVIVRKFLAGRIRGRINRRPAFIYHHNIELPRKAEALDERLCFPSGGPVAYSDCLYTKTAAQFPNLPGGLSSCLVAEMGENSVVMEQFALPVETYDLAARPEPGVNSKDVFSAQRWGKQETA